MNSIVILILPLFLGLVNGFESPFSNDLTGKMADPNKTLNIKTEEFLLQIVKSALKIPKNLIRLIRNVDTNHPGKRGQNLSSDFISSRNQSQYSKQGPEMGYSKLMVFLIEHICRLIGLIS